MDGDADTSSASTARPWPRWAVWTLRIVLGGCVLWAVGYVVLLVLLFSTMETPYTGKQPLPFSRETWLSSTGFQDGTRYLMLNDLTAKHTLVGMNREQVLTLLGPMQPPGYPGFGDCYYLGPEDHPFAVDNAWLILTFKDDLVTAYEVGTD